MHLHVVGHALFRCHLLFLTLKVGSLLSVCGLAQMPSGPIFILPLHAMKSSTLVDLGTVRCDKGLQYQRCYSLNKEMSSLQHMANWHLCRTGLRYTNKVENNPRSPCAHQIWGIIPGNLPEHCCNNLPPSHLLQCEIPKQSFTGSEHCFGPQACAVKVNLNSSLVTP